VDKEGKTLARLSKLYPRDIGYLQDLGNRAYQAGKRDDALSHFLAIKKVKPSLTKNDLKIGLIYYEKKAFPKAEEFLSKAVGKNSDGLEKLTQTYLKLNLKKKALAVLKKRAGLAPKEQKLAKQVVSLSEETKVGSSALLSAYADLLKLQPANRDIQIKKARLEIKIPGKKESALKTIIQLDASDIDSRLQLAATYRQKKQFEKALPVLQEAATLNKKSYQILDWLGEAYLKMGKKADAIRVLEKNYPWKQRI